MNKLSFSSSVKVLRYSFQFFVLKLKLSFYQIQFLIKYFIQKLIKLFIEKINLILHNNKKNLLPIKIFLEDFRFAIKLIIFSRRRIITYCKQSIQITIFSFLIILVMDFISRKFIIPTIKLGIQLLGLLLKSQIFIFNCLLYVLYFSFIKFYSIQKNKKI